MDLPRRIRMDGQPHHHPSNRTTQHRPQPNLPRRFLTRRQHRTHHGTNTPKPLRRNHPHLRPLRTTKRLRQRLRNTPTLLPHDRRTRPLEKNLHPRQTRPHQIKHPSPSSNARRQRARNPSRTRRRQRTRPRHHLVPAKLNSRRMTSQTPHPQHPHHPTTARPRSQDSAWATQDSSSPQHPQAPPQPLHH